MVFAKSNIGKMRDNNQDYYYISSTEDIAQLYILADGMGGYKGGEIASKLATEAVRRYVQDNFNKITKVREQIIDLVNNAVQYANMVVYEKSKETKELEGMGTTLEVCLIYNNKVYIAHIGDSRIYRIRRGVIKKLTVDHSYVQQLVEDGKITKEEANHHPKKNMLTKALGCTIFSEPDILVRNFDPGDIFVMCSDGLTNMVEEEKIFDIVTTNPEIAVDRLIQEANEAGGYDNITVVIIM